MSNLAADESHIDLLHFFKALADETRLKMAALLTSKPRSGEQLAELLAGATPNPFVDPQGCRAFFAKAEAEFERRLALATHQ